MHLIHPKYISTISKMCTTFTIILWIMKQMGQYKLESNIFLVILWRPKSPQHANVWQNLKIKGNS